MKKYVLYQLTQVSTWLGFLIILATLFANRDYIFLLGAALMVTHDDLLKNWVAKAAPWLSAKIEEWTR